MGYKAVPEIENTQSVMVISLSDPSIKISKEEMDDTHSGWKQFRCNHLEAFHTFNKFQACNQKIKYKTRIMSSQCVGPNKSTI